MSERNTGVKKRTLFNPDNSGYDIFRTIKTTYHKISTANLIRGGAYGASGVLEIETIQELINADSNGNARAIRACYGQCGFDSVFRGGGQGITGVMEEIEPKIAASRGRGEGWQQQLEINDGGTPNTITSVSKDNLLVEPRINLVGQYDSSQNSRIIGTEGISYCMANGHKDGMPKIAEPNVLRAERTEECKKLRKQNGDKGMKFNDGNKQYSPRTDGISNTLSTITKDNMLAVPELRMEDGCLVDKEGRRYRIRKLTPTECFRLMDVDDSDIEKMKQAGIAKTNLYKLAGNSIVISCMYHLFRKLFIEKDCETQTLL